MHENILSQYTVIKVKKFVCKQIPCLWTLGIWVLDLEVLQKGETVGKKIGNPVTIGKVRL